MIILYGCENPQTFSKVVIEENFGLTRDLEYVKIELPENHEEEIMLKDSATGQSILAKRINSVSASNDLFHYIFPVSIEANERKALYITKRDAEMALTGLDISGKDMAIKIENEFFIADFGTTEAKIKAGLFPGQLAGIFVKNREVLLKRGHLNMHWAPNFQKEGLNYKTIGHVPDTNAIISQKNDYILEITKAGNVENYEEIDLYGRYNFFAGLPYFEYTSTMSFNKDTELVLLRNDEMTIDSLFTHLVYPDPLGEVSFLPLYDQVKFDSLTKAPLSDAINWVGFINKPLKYGLISLRLDYDNSNLDGIESPLYQAHTKISSSSGNGRYWNRRLIHEHKTLVTKGSKYYERNAYLVVDNLDNLRDQIDLYLSSLKHPVQVSFGLEYLENRKD
jgi:hypothetical protein